MLILGIIVWGMAAGWIAQAILGRTGGGPGGKNNWAEAIGAGLVGSFVGGAIGSMLGDEGFALKPSGLIGTVIGAIIVLAIWGAIRGRK